MRAEALRVQGDSEEEKRSSLLGEKSRGNESFFLNFQIPRTRILFFFRSRWYHFVFEPLAPTNVCQQIFSLSR